MMKPTAVLRALLFVLLAAPVADVAAERQPDIVLVDDLGWSDLGCYGADLIETTHIDRLATDADSESRLSGRSLTVRNGRCAPPR